MFVQLLRNLTLEFIFMHTPSSYPFSWTIKRFRLRFFNYYFSPSLAEFNFCVTICLLRSGSAKRKNINFWLYFLSIRFEFMAIIIEILWNVVQFNKENKLKVFRIELTAHGATAVVDRLKRNISFYREFCATSNWRWRGFTFHELYSCWFLHFWWYTTWPKPIKSVIVLDFSHQYVAAMEEHIPMNVICIALALKAAWSWPKWKKVSAEMEVISRIKASCSRSAFE